MRTHGFKIVPFFCQKLDLYFKGESGSDGCIVKGVACCLCTRDLTLIPWDPKTEHWTNFSQLCSNIYIFLLALWQVIAHNFLWFLLVKFSNFPCFSFFYRSEKDFTDSAGLNSLPDVGSTMEVSWCHFTFSPTWFFTSTHNAKRKSWKKSLKCAINIFFLWAYKALIRFFFWKKM